MGVPGRSGARAEPHFAVWSVALYGGVIVTSIKWDILFMWGETLAFFFLWQPVHIILRPKQTYRQL